MGAAVNYESSKKLLELKKIYPDLRIALGIHPEYPEIFSDYQAVEKLIQDNHSELSAVGEIGLPYFSLQDIAESEKSVLMTTATCLLEKFIVLGKRYNLPLILHAVFDTAPLALDLLEKHGIKKALFHWFEGDIKSLHRLIRNGYLVSVSPDVMYNQKYSEFVDNIPTECICLESDGPWEYEGRKGTPEMVEETAEYLGSRRGISKDKIYKISYENFKTLTIF